MDPNSLDFPRMLYRMPGTEEIHGGKFSSMVADSQEGMDKARADGWHLTTGDALTAYRAKQEEAAANAPATRAELLKKAKELGLKLTVEHSDADIATMIENKLKA